MYRTQFIEFLIDYFIHPSVVPVIIENTFPLWMKESTNVQECVDNVIEEFSVENVQ